MEFEKKNKENYAKDGIEQKFNQINEFSGKVEDNRGKEKRYFDGYCK